MKAHVVGSLDLDESMGNNVEVGKFFFRKDMPPDLETLVRSAVCPKTGIVADKARLFLVRN
jgi:hypothetical protein